MMPPRPTANIRRGEANPAAQPTAEENARSRQSRSTEKLNHEGHPSTDVDEVTHSGTLAEIKAMLERERHYACRDYYDLLKGTIGSKGTKLAAVSSRAKVCKWMFQIVHRANLSRETAHVAIGYLDRFLSSSSSRAQRAKRNKGEYELASLTCLYIAVKVTEPGEAAAMMTPATISRLSRGRHSERDVIACEHHVLSSLRWRLNGPTTLQFVDRIVDLLPTDSARAAGAPKLRQLRADCRRRAEACVEDYACVPLPCSVVAVASVLNSIEELTAHLDPIEEDEELIQFIQLMYDAFDVDDALMDAVRKRLTDRSSAGGGNNSQTTS